MVLIVNNYYGDGLNVVLRSFRPLTGIMVLIAFLIFFFASPLRVSFRPLTGIMVLIVNPLAY